MDGSGTPVERWILPNWCMPSEGATSWSQLTDVTFVNPVKSNVWKIKGGLEVDTLNVSMTVPPPASVPVNVVDGGDSNA